MDKRERHFVLVHGAMHGAWCWYKVATLLQSVGHKVTSLDMAASGVHPKQPNEVTSFSEYIEPLTQFMKALPSEERVILVGHSAGGGCISVAMENFPYNVSVAVFAAALMPGPNLSFAALTKEFIRRLGTSSSSEGSEKRLPISVELAWHDRLGYSFKQLCPPEDVALANSLMRPSPTFVDEELFEKETTFTKEKFGRVAKVYIMSEQDRAIKEDFQRWMIDEHPPDEVKQIIGSDHCLMFSTPIQLFSCLEDISLTNFHVSGLGAGGTKLFLMMLTGVWILWFVGSILPAKTSSSSWMLPHKRAVAAPRANQTRPAADCVKIIVNGNCSSSPI